MDPRKLKGAREGLSTGYQVCPPFWFVLLTPFVVHCEVCCAGSQGLFRGRQSAVRMLRQGGISQLLDGDDTLDHITLLCVKFGA